MDILYVSLLILAFVGLRWWNPRRKPSKAELRLRAYEEQANRLRIAWIACSESSVPDIIAEIIRLNRQFEREDYPNEGN